MMNEVLVIDIGGTKTTVSLVDSSDMDRINVINSETFLTFSNPEHQIQKIISTYKDQNLQTENLSLSLPGKWDKDGVLQESYFLNNWLGFPFISKLEEELKIKNHAWETDVICGALGEYYFGVIETLRATSLLYINLGTGIGAAFIDKQGRPFKTDNKLTLRLQKLLFTEDTILYRATDLISGGELIKFTNHKSIEELYSAYKKGEVEAIDLISKAQLRLVTWLINLFYLFAPDVIVLNGGLTYDWEVLAEGAIDIANQELEGQVKILPSKLKEQAPIYGAYVNFIHHNETIEITSLHS